MKRRQPPVIGLSIGLIAIILIVTLLVRVGLFSSGGKAEDVVEAFYKYEQKGDFASSWGFFHSSMKEKFSKGAYIQDRAHVFMNHFGVDTFSFTMGKTEEIKSWKMSKDAKPLDNVHKVLITQTYKGKYGTFNLQQEVFVVKEKGEWRVMWDYNK